MGVSFWLSVSALVFGSLGVVLNLIALRQNLRREKGRRLADEERSKPVGVRYLCPYCAREVNFAVRGDQVTCSACHGHSKLEDWRRIIPERPKTVLMGEHESFSRRKNT